MILTSVLRDLFAGRARRTRLDLSVIVNFYNNRREARNTLHSLTRDYQLDSTGLAYEVIAIDNGSSYPLLDAEVRAFGPEFQYQFMATRSVSPVASINAACRHATADILLVMIDGAHILSPGIFRLVQQAFQQFSSPFVATVPFHLGPKSQNLSVPEGYNQDIEDKVLAASRWRENGYRLYSVAGALADNSGGWYGQLFESGCFAIRKSEYMAMGGFDERFQSPGGGLTSLDFFQRALMRRELDYVLLLGEATFHQVHGGVATNASMKEHPWNNFHREYQQIRGRPFGRVPRRPILLGAVPKEAQRMVARSMELATEIWRERPALFP